MTTDPLPSRVETMMRSTLTRRFAPRAARGFTLVELMIAVAIVAVLAAVAAVGLRYQTRKARITQAEAMLGAIAAAQAGRDPYIGTGSGAPSYCPNVTMGPRAVAWDTTCEQATWATLGLATPNQTYFQFGIIAGGAADNCAAGAPICNTWTSGDRWWIAVARGDLDGDGTLSTFITSYSLQGTIIRIDEME